MSGVPIIPQDAENVVRAIGLVFNNMSLYSPEHSVTKTAIKDCISTLESTLDRYGTLSFLIAEETLSINDFNIELKNPLMKMFVSHLAAREIGNFTLSKGLTEKELNELLDVLGSKPSELHQFGGLAAAIEKFGLKHIHVSKITYKQIAEDELVISKDQLDELAEGAGASSETIVAFLKGEIDSGEGLAESMSDMASDADKLSELILKAADIGESPADLSSGETMGDMVVGCLKKFRESIENDPSLKTKKGKKSLEKTLLLLEKELIEKMRASAQDCSELDEKAISEAVETMVDELEIDTLAGDYMKKRNAIENNENRILRFIRSKGLDKIQDTDLEEKLMSGGLSLEGWHELLAKSGAGNGIGTGAAGGIAAVGHLAMLLEKMEDDIQKLQDKGEGTGEDAGSEFSGLMKDVGQEVEKMVFQTEKKIQKLVVQVKEDNSEDAGTAGKKGEKALSKKKLLEMLAEIVQELCQPLAVIHCSIEMMLGGCIGEISEQQTEMLSLADESGKKLQQLIDHLLEISGVPTTLKPDQEIQASVYDKDKGQKKV